MQKINKIFSECGHILIDFFPEMHVLFLFMTDELAFAISIKDCHIRQSKN